MATITMPDNQSFELEDEIANDNEMLRAALKTAYPDAANATFERSGGKDGKPLVVKVIKRAGTKGNVLTDLLAASDQPNPAVTMQRRLEEMERAGQLDHLVILGLKDEIQQAIKDGNEEINAVERAFSALKKAPAEASTIVPRGF